MMTFMQSMPVTVRRWSARAVVLLLLVLAGLAFPAAPAHAHGQLALSRPLSNTIVNDPLERVELYFTEQPASFAHFTVTGPTGRIDNGWSTGEPIRLDKPVQEYFLVDGKWTPRAYHVGYPAIVPIAHWPAAGPYLVEYMSVASDGDAVRGSVKFEYNGPTTAAPPGWSPPTNTPPQALLDQIGNGHGGGDTGRTQQSSPAAGDTVAAPPVTAPSDGSGSLTTWLIPGALVAATVLILLHASRKRR
ncbi:hypothetical protein BC793_13243 [Actinoplanes xinjiangensis]|uniref:CopC domain-containing protein n=2 Tax=Actinoplanes xinjiangensis TaxID=512350 RepID=A0A316F503_9ACTN|nr:hypothetical protein BC793_13243 [Actinoplanes xinjiangensis]